MAAMISQDDDDNSSKVVVLDSGCVLRTNSHRVALDLTADTDTSGAGWTALSSAILNGGLYQLLPSNNNTAHVLNSKVPADYDGLHPNPLDLARRLAQEQEGLDPTCTIGLLTAASMDSMRTATRSAPATANGGSGTVVVVDVIVTAGISNARTAGADADYFFFCDSDNDDDERSPSSRKKKKNSQKDSTKATTNDKSTTKSSSSPNPPGTINTIIVTNGVLTSAAMVEAFAIAVEAKCAACADLGVMCAKSDKNEVAQGTGTDATVLISANADGRRQRLQHAGKHTLFAEMVGQAVREATREAILSNIRYLHGHYFPNYVIRQWCRRLANTLCGAARPCIPPRPMMPVPWAPPSVLAVGSLAVMLAFLCSPVLPHAAQVILAVLAWDRCLGELPLCIHPVCLVGRWISFILRHGCPDFVFTNPVIGFAGGWMMLISTVLVSLTTYWLIQGVAESSAAFVVNMAAASSRCSNSTVDLVSTVTSFMVWLLEVAVVKSATSLQLLCTLALQMAKFLERRQISDARAQLSWLCSRDPSNLNSEELAAGTLESLSENLSDGFVAPLCWYIACGPLGALGYRVVNTLDSRIGYHGKYEWFGKPSARLDDILNLVPARITALLLSAAAMAVPGCSARAGLRVAWRDFSLCESPNAGWPMGAMAGLLGIVLEKKGEYSLGRRGAGNSASGETVPCPQRIRAGHQVAQLAGGMAAVIAVTLCSFLYS